MSSNLKRDPLYTASEVQKMFGYSTLNSLMNAVRVGKFPEADVRLKPLKAGKPRPYWSKSLVERERLRRIEINNSGRTGRPLKVF